MILRFLIARGEKVKQIVSHCHLNTLYCILSKFKEGFYAALKIFCPKSSKIFEIVVDKSWKWGSETMETEIS